MNYSNILSVIGVCLILASVGWEVARMLKKKNSDLTPITFPDIAIAIGLGIGIFLLFGSVSWYFSIPLTLLFFTIPLSAFAIHPFRMKKKKAPYAGMLLCCSALFLLGFLGTTFLAKMHLQKGTFHLLLLFGGVMVAFAGTMLFADCPRSFNLKTVFKIGWTTLILLGISMVIGSISNTPLATICASFLVFTSLKFAWKTIKAFSKKSKSSDLQKLIGPIGALISLGLLALLISETSHNPLINFL